MSECDSHMRSKIIPMISEIEDGLFIGNLECANNPVVLRYNHITHVITCLTKKDHYVTCVHEYDDIDHTCIRVSDSETENISKYFYMIWLLISARRSNGVVTLIHGRAGISRSASLVIAFIMRDRGMGYNDAFNEVKSKRRCIDPNVGFVRQLREYEKELRLKGVIKS